MDKNTNEPITEAPVLSPKKARRQAALRRRTHNVILAFVFLLAVCLFALINLATGDKEFSDTENRKLAQKPVFSASALVDGSYFSGLVSHYTDQFFARDGWISLRLREEKLRGQKESGGVYLGSDGYLLAKPETPDDEALSNTIDAVNQFSENHSDLGMNVMLVPCAAAIMPDKLPKNAPVRDQLADISAVEARLSTSIAALDPVKALQSHSSEYIYYKTDHHWTSLGAYYAFTAVSGALGITAPASDYQIYTVSDSFQGTLASKSGSHSSSDSIDIYTPQGTDVDYYVNYTDTQEKSCSLYVSSCLQDKDQYTVFFGGNHPLVEINTTCNNHKNLLVFKDSFANCFMQFLTPYYEKIIMIDPRYYYDNVESVISSYGITDVLFLYSANTFLTDTSLADVLNSGVPVVTEEPASTVPSVFESSTEESSAESSVESSVLEP